VVHIGLPVTADLQTLDLDTTQGETLAGKKKLIQGVIAVLEDTRGVWSGVNPPSDDSVDPLENLTELKIRSSEDYDDPTALSTKAVDLTVKGEWNDHGRIFLRQVDPLPMSVLSVAPTGYIPYRR